MVNVKTYTDVRYIYIYMLNIHVLASVESIFGFMEDHNIILNIGTEVRTRTLLFRNVNKCIIKKKVNTKIYLHIIKNKIFHTQ
jgi:hypothetical protein